MEAEGFLWWVETVVWTNGIHIHLVVPLMVSNTKSTVSSKLISKRDICKKMIQVFLLRMPLHWMLYSVSATQSFADTSAAGCIVWESLGVLESIVGIPFLLRVWIVTRRHLVLKLHKTEGR